MATLPTNPSEFPKSKFIWDKFEYLVKARGFLCVIRFFLLDELSNNFEFVARSNRNTSSLNHHHNSSIIYVFRIRIIHLCEWMHKLLSIKSFSDEITMATCVVYVALFWYYEINSALKTAAAQNLNDDTIKVDLHTYIHVRRVGAATANTSYNNRWRMSNIKTFIWHKTITAKYKQEAISCNKSRTFFLKDNIHQLLEIIELSQISFTRIS